MIVLHTTIISLLIAFRLVIESSLSRHEANQSKLRQLDGGHEPVEILQIKKLAARMTFLREELWTLKENMRSNSGGRGRSSSKFPGGRK